MKHNSDNFKIYSLNKNYEEKVFSLDKTRIQKILGMISEIQGKKEIGNILDIGCLSGRLLYNTKKAWNRYGMDIINEPPKFDKGAIFIKHNVEEKFPFKNKFFDIIVAGEIIEHVYDTDFFLEEIYRTLKARGFLIISTPNLNSFINRFLILVGKYPRYLEYKKGGAGHIHIYNLMNLKNQLIEKGFSIVKIKGNFLSLPDPTKNKILRNSILKRLGNLFPAFSENIIILGRKK